MHDRPTQYIGIGDLLEAVRLLAINVKRLETQCAEIEKKIDLLPKRIIEKKIAGKPIKKKWWNLLG